MAKTDLTAQRLRQLFSYDPETGLFTRLVKTWPGSYIGEVMDGIEPNGYVSFVVDGYRHRAHRLAWLYMMKRWPSAEIDHRDRCRSNNAWENLRDATSSGNQHNRGAQANNASCGVIGVTRSKQADKPWRAQICVDGKRFNLGNFASVDLASRAYQDAKRRLHTSI